ncbi:hypothetical protein CkaCkLH20_05598 [Colletotrichum karsti]|uniref:Uncharacterized protein n=1 Tax=Colletotrichum karsti TaxID=1095194 RepID=A0A9P6LLM9_9PEZI|nr:uncharacterized protein CkaCkLH20_05598 [Colletotrichum karsti]KAF9876752.1 hypothetical protein CkaCkLH20_05598 [Colletotrichum karsti]
MAEAIGIASGAIAFADFAGKAISLSIKLKLLWDEVKEVPAFLLEKVEELQDLGELLSHAERQAADELAPASVWSTAAMQKAIGRARAAMGDLQQAVDVLYAQVVDKRRHKRRFAAARVVIQKNDLEMMEKKLDQALRRYQMAQNLYLVSCASIMVDHLSQPRTATETALVRQDNSVATELASSLAVAKPATVEAIISDAVVISTGSTVLGRIHMGFGEKGYRVSMRTPAWLGGAVYAIMAKRSIMGWQLNLSTYAVVPIHPQELIAAVKADDVTGLQKQLCGMNLTPFVHDQNGLNLLHYAVTNEAMETTKWLLMSGLPPGSYEEVDISDTSEFCIVFVYFLSPSTTKSRTTTSDDVLKHSSGKAAV